MSASLEELKFCQQHGACGVFMRGIEGQRLITDPYFYPLYEEISRLNLAVGVHVGNGNPQVIDLVSQYNGEVASEVSNSRHRRIPFGDYERSAKVVSQAQISLGRGRRQWIPYVVKDLQRRWGAQGKELPENLMKEYRQYVSCQTDDDVDCFRYSKITSPSAPTTVTTINPPRSKRSAICGRWELSLQASTRRSPTIIRRRSSRLRI